MNHLVENLSLSGFVFMPFKWKKNVYIYVYIYIYEFVSRKKLRLCAIIFACKGKATIVDLTPFKTMFTQCKWPTELKESLEESRLCWHKERWCTAKIQPPGTVYVGCQHWPWQPWAPAIIAVTVAVAQWSLPITTVEIMSLSHLLTIQVIAAHWCRGFINTPAPHLRAKEGVST